METRSIVEYKETLAGERKRFRCTLVARAPGEVVVRYVLSRDGQVAGLRLPRGTVSFGYFWTHRPYNVYHFVEPDGTTRALYVNIVDRTRLTTRAVHWRDLTVDLLITPDGRCQVLDEDELPPDLDPALRAWIAAARDDVAATYPALLAEVERRSAALLAGLAPVDG